MGRRFGFLSVLFFAVWMVTACGIGDQGVVQTVSSHVPDVSDVSDDGKAQVYQESMEYRGEEVDQSAGDAYDLFLDNELPAVYGESCIYYGDYRSGGFIEEEEYGISRLDLDNDGREELVIDSVGHYGAMVIDLRGDILYILALGEGTAGICSYTFIGDEAWIVHSDTTHGGRQMFWFERFNGDGEVVDQFTLSAEYWDEPGGGYTENSDFTCRDEKITMQEYEDLRMSYMGW